MKIKDSISNAFKSNKIMMKVPTLFGELKKTKNWLREKGFLGAIWKKMSISGEGVVDHNIDFVILKTCYEKIPKVFRAINMRAEFAIQGGFKLVSDNQADIDKINEWKRKNHLDNILLPIARGMLTYGDMFNEILGEEENTRITFLPVKQMRVKRATATKNGTKYFTHDVKSYVQVNDTGKVLNEWLEEDKKVIHFKWNWDGIEPYGTSEIRPALTVLADKLDAEAVIPRILKFHADPRIIYQCGRPDTPYNKAQMTTFISELEGRVVGGDVAVPGDVTPIPIQPIRGTGEMVQLLDHIEAQIDICLNNPASLFISGKADGQASLTVMDAIERDVKTIQDIIGTELEQMVFPKILGKDEVPEISWNPMNIETFLRLSRTLRQLVGKKQERIILTPNEARRELGMGKVDEEEVQKIVDMEKPMPMFGGGGNEPNSKIQPNGKKDGRPVGGGGQKPPKDNKPVQQ